MKSRAILLVGLFTSVLAAPLPPLPVTPGAIPPSMTIADLDYILQHAVNPSVTDACRTALQRSSLWYPIVHECQLANLQQTAQPSLGYKSLCGNQAACSKALTAWYQLVQEKCGDQDVIPAGSLPENLKRHYFALRQEGPTIAGVVRPPLGFDMNSVTLSATHVYEMVTFSLDMACTTDSQKQPCLALLNSKLKHGVFNNTNPPIDQGSMASAAMYIAQDPRFLCDECTNNLAKVLIEHKQTSLFDSLGMSYKVDQVSTKIQQCNQGSLPSPVRPVHPTFKSKTIKTRPIYTESIPVPQTIPAPMETHHVETAAPEPTDDPIFSIQTSWPDFPPSNDPPMEQVPIEIHQTSEAAPTPTETIVETAIPTEEVEWVYEDGTPVDPATPETASASEGQAVAAFFAELVMYLRDLTPADLINGVFPPKKPEIQQVFPSLPSKTVPVQHVMETEGLPWAAGVDAGQEITESAPEPTYAVRETHAAYVESVPTQLWS